MARSIGTRNRCPQMMAETGLPGRPSIGTPFSRPAISGLPGRIAIFQKACSNPADLAHQIVITDRGPADGHDQIGPVGQRQHGRSSASVSRAMGKSRASPPAASTIAFSAKLFEAMIWSGRGSSPGITSSSPVAISATTGLRVGLDGWDVHRGQ
jgi:hypothetical protein